jgi:hypothetical protein
MPPPDPRLADPGSTPRFAYRGTAKLDPPLVDEQPIGPLRGHVTVVPVVRLDRRPYFTVSAEWGPNPDGSPVPGLFNHPAHHVADMAAVGTEVDARRLARAAIDQLRTPPTDRPALDLIALARRLVVPLLKQ